MALGSRLIVTLPLFYQQLFYCPIPPPEVEEVPAFNYVEVTTSAVRRRTLFYQAHVNPPPTADLQAAAFEPAPGKWMPRWQGPPKYQPNRGPFGAYGEPLPPPVVVDNINAVTSTTTAGINRKTLFYQSRVAPVGVPTVEVVVSTVEWVQPFSRATPRAIPRAVLYTPFVAPPAPQITIDEWAQPFKRQVAGPFPVHTQPITAYPSAPQVTPDEWMPAWQGPPRRLSRLLGGQPFVPEEATVENTVDQGWRVALSEPVAARPVWHTQPFFGYPYESVVVDNTQTPDKWLIAWKGPPRIWPPRIAAQPFVPKEATLENTVDQGWRTPLSTPVPRRPVWWTQPAYGFPYEGVDNSRFEWDWTIQWQGPPRYWPLGKPFQPFVPKEATLENTQTPDKWLEAWQGPPRRLQRLQPGSPFVAREAVLENTQTPDKWLVRFQKAVPAPPVRHTQPFFGYPYETQAIVVPYEQWWHQPLSRPAARPAVRRQPFQPFVPREATRENTVPSGWWQPLGKPVAARPVRWTQPFYGYPYEAAVVTPPTTFTVGQAQLFKRTLQYQATPFVPKAQPPNLTTTLEWLQRWRDPPRRIQRLQPGSPFVPKAAVFDVQTPDKWMQRWQGPPRVLLRLQPGQPFVAKEAVRENTQTPDKWLVRFQKAVPHGWPTHTQPFFGYPYIDEYPIGGPADEDERVACVPRASRVATAPLLLRVVAVPLQGREAIVPLDRSCSAQVVAEDDTSGGTGSGYYGSRYYGRHYYGAHYWGGSLGNGVTVTASGNGYYGHRYYGRHYFGAHYWGGALVSVTVAEVDLLRVVCVPYQSRVVQSNEYRDGRACHDT